MTAILNKWVLNFDLKHYRVGSSTGLSVVQQGVNSIVWVQLNVLRKAQQSTLQPGECWVVFWTLDYQRDNDVKMRTAYIKSQIWYFWHTQFPGLFDGCSFYFSGDFKSTPSKPELLRLIKLGGGRILHREPKVETAHPLITDACAAVMKMMSSSETLEIASIAYHAKPNTGQSHCTQYILFDPECSAGHKRINTPIMCTASKCWLMDCVSRFEILEVKDD